MKHWNDKEYRESVASICKSKSEYQHKYSRAYEISRLNNEINVFALKFNWKSKSNNVKRIIYAFVFEKYKSVYIGLTCDESRRKQEHILNKWKKFSSVYKFIINNNLSESDYNYILLTDYIDEIDAVKLEAYYMDYYLNLGYNLLCKRNNAGNLGGVTIKLNRLEREKIASKCKTRTEYAKLNFSAYNKSLKMKEMDEFALKFNWIIIQKPSGYWNIKENRINAASLCVNITDYNKKYHWSYTISRKNNELIEFTKKFNWKINI